MQNIYFTERFINYVENPNYSIELTKFKLGTFNSPDGDPITHPSQIDLEYLSKVENTSPTQGYYEFESIFDKEIDMLQIYIKTSELTDATISDKNNYKILYVMFRDVLSDDLDLAFIIYDKSPSGIFELNYLNLSRTNNLISIEIPFQCEVHTKMDRDTKHLESCGVNTVNYFQIPDGELNTAYINKLTFDSFLKGKLSNNAPYYGEVTLNNFGLKTY